MSVVEKSAIAVVVALLIGATCHVVVKRYWLATSIAALIGAVLGFAAFEIWRSPTYSTMALMFAFLAIDAFILAAGVGIPFRRRRSVTRE